MRVVDTFTQGGFPKLVLESKREFASKYGLKAEYWRHFKPEESPEVLAYLKTNLKDLATHYHAQYQNGNEPNEKLTNYREASQWYGAYPSPSRRKLIRHPSTISLPTCFWRTRILGRRPNSMSARLTHTRRIRSRQLQDTPRSMHTASS